MRTAATVLAALCGVFAGGCIPIILPWPHFEPLRPAFDGVVLDRITSKPVSGAEVTVKFTDGPAKVKTNADGRFHLDATQEFVPFVLLGPNDRNLWLPMVQGLDVKSPGYHECGIGFLSLPTRPAPGGDCDCSFEKGICTVRLAPVTQSRPAEASTKPGP